MCGIAGIIKKNNEKVEKSEINKMLKSIKHRGPDGENIYLDDNIGFGHVLLKIQDISDASIQPYEYNDLVLCYNGEIYNYKELREELISKNYSFDTDGDTEVLIKLLNEYGLDKTLDLIEGCFAFSIYNKKTKTTYIVRDRFGIKPLYYYFGDNKIIFCSEIKGIIENDGVPRKFNLETVMTSLNCRLWMDPENTLFEGIKNLTPGCYIKIENNTMEKIQYYKLEFKNTYKNSDDLIKDFSKEFESSVQKKLLSKVPVAAFLSGGLDSSIVCKLLSDYSEQKLSTYTICYDFDNDWDLNHAEELAQKEKYDQHNILITEDMYNIENIDKVTYAVEEILIDKVYIPMYFNYKAAKDDGFTVVVSGQGSDEVWLGYIFTWKIFQYIKEKYNKDILINDYYMSNMIFKDKINSENQTSIKGYLKNYLENYFVQDSNDQMNSYGDLSLKTILHDLLVQEDKIAMIHSVESRVPFVDNHKIVELAYNSSSQIKTFDGREKYIVRKYSEGKIPDSIVKREKYPVPEPPKIYNGVITKLCKENWEDIINSKLIKKIMKKEVLNDINNFSEVEQWWLLVYWRFENVFKMEV